MISPHLLEPETIAHIEYLATDSEPCPCDTTRACWSVCDFHLGFNEATEMQRHTHLRFVTTVKEST
jgi:hypothetical protein